jgi:hypothetical protein
MFAASSTYATIIVDVQEVGVDVVVSYSGTLDLNSTSHKAGDINVVLEQLWDLGNGGLQTYNVNGQVDDYDLVASSIVRPVVTDIFGITLYGGSVTGDSLLFDFGWTYGQIWVPDAYVSNAAISGTNIFSNTSFVDLSPTIETFEWSWYNGSSSGNLILTVGQAQSVPEPANIALFGLGLVGIGFARRRRS